ncbi:hypothetical protein ACQKLP_02195 [Chitinophaga sp. NPDC101104]|uniref:hypothetical protein n=1 Tax=Chitinophaga sp. NPDC101104 TaxID=3390561 RepID=UPI003D04584D
MIKKLLLLMLPVFVLTSMSFKSPQPSEPRCGSYLTIDNTYPFGPRITGMWIFDMAAFQESVILSYPYNSAVALSYIFHPGMPPAHSYSFRVDVQFLTSINLDDEYELCIKNASGTIVEKETFTQRQFGSVFGRVEIGTFYVACENYQMFIRRKSIIP